MGSTGFTLAYYRRLLTLIIVAICEAEQQAMIWKYQSQKGLPSCKRKIRNRGFFKSLDIVAVANHRKRTSQKCLTVTFRSLRPSGQGRGSGLIQAAPGKAVLGGLKSSQAKAAPTFSRCKRTIRILITGPFYQIKLLLSLLALRSQA